MFGSTKKESNKSRFDSFSRYEQSIDRIPYYLLGLSRAHFFRQPFSKQAVYQLNTVILLCLKRVFFRLEVYERVGK